MLNWLYSWWYFVPGPARNAPNDGVDIKKFVENKPTSVSVITETEIKTAMNNLNRVNVIHKPSGYTAPLIREFNEVFEMGYENFLKQRREKLKKIP